MATRDESLADRIAALSPAKRALLLRQVKQRTPPPSGIAIGRRTDEGPAPLSYAQQRLWFFDQLQPGSTLYNIGRALSLRGPLDVRALSAALTGVVARHEALRTTFRASVESGVHAGEPVQVIVPARPVELPAVDLSGRPDGLAEAARQAEALARRPFDLTTDLMLRAALWRLEDRHHVLLLGVHHIAWDGLSDRILMRELSELYGAAITGRAPALAPLPIQYADFAVWQRRWLSGPVVAEQLGYWRGQLEGAMPLRLPADRRREVNDWKGAATARILPSGLSDAIRALARRERATMYMTLLAAFQALLFRYTGQADVTIGSPVAGRVGAETEPLIGFFVNTILLRTDLSGDPPFLRLLERVREVALNAYAHQDIPFDTVVEELRPERSFGRTPWVNVMFAFEENPERLALNGLDVTRVPLSGGRGAKFDLTVNVTNRPEGLQLFAEYAVGLFDAQTIQQFLENFEELLANVVADPTQRLSALPVLGAHDAVRMAGWNATDRAYPADTGLAPLFDAQVHRAPEAVAVVASDQRITYAELDGRATQFARALHRAGVRRGGLVGICLDRSVEMVVAILAVVKAGGAYVPVDPANPDERRAAILRDAGVAAVISVRPCPGLDPTVPQIPLPEAGISAASVGENDPVPNGAMCGADLAYVMYTSGSTGQPKGVAVPQRAVARLVVNADYVSLGPEDVVAHASNVAFDAATFEIWGALLNGARLVILAKDVMLSASDLGEALAAHGVTALFLTTALFNQIVREAPAVLRNVRHVLFGGEPVEPRWVEELLANGPPERLLHVYGPTEATTFATWHRVTGLAPNAITVPIGHPITNTQVHVLNAQLRPVPVGLPGELYIGGPGLARGYHRCPDVTAERFLPDPWGAEPGGRLYRTGDIVRYRVDGGLEFLARADHQVKIRGYRVEPGEIEAALERAVATEAVVVPLPDAGGGHRLVAYLRPTGAHRPDAAALRAALRSSLPEYMVPSAFQWVDVWPLTPSGKVDRRALAAAPWPEDAADEPEAGPRRPRNPLEMSLVGIWEELLGVRPIGIHDSFFQRGGHSLLAVQMLRRVEEVCGRRLPVATLYAGDTIAYLADVIRSEAAEFYGTLVTEVQVGARPPFFFLHGDYNGGGFYSIQLARALGPEQTFYALHPHGPDGRPVPATIEAMAEDQLVIVRQLQPTGPYYLGGHCNGGLIAFEMARRLRAIGETVAFLAVMDASAMNTRLHSVMWRVRHRTEGLRSGGRYYAWRTRHLLAAGPSAWAPFIKRQLAARRALGAMSPGQPGPDLVDQRSELNAAYWRAIRSYVPGHYGGSVTVFKAQEFHARRPDIGWGMVADRVETLEIPGTHLSFITLHVDVLADRLRACLRRAQGE